MPAQTCSTPSSSSSLWYVLQELPVPGPQTPSTRPGTHSLQCPPVRVTRETLDKASRASLVFGALKRRGDWPNIGEAAKIRQSPFFASWHPEAFELWLSHGLVPLTDSPGASKNGAVQLATPKWGEAAVFAETEGLGLGWDKLAEVKVPVGFVMAGDATATDGEATTREMVWRPTVSANERLMDAGHLVRCHCGVSSLSPRLRPAGLCRRTAG